MSLGMSLLAVLCFTFAVCSVEGLKAPPSKYMGKVVSCLTCPHVGDHHAKRFAEGHTHQYDGLELEEVFDEDIHHLVVSDRATGEEVARHDISELEHHEIQNLAIKNGIRPKPSDRHRMTGRRMRAEIQHCSSCDTAMGEGEHSPIKLAQSYSRMYRDVEVAKGVNQVRNSHDLVLFDATGRELERHDMAQLNPKSTHAILSRRGLKLEMGGRPHHIVPSG